MKFASWNISVSSDYRR